MKMTLFTAFAAAATMVAAPALAVTKVVTFNAASAVAAANGSALVANFGSIDHVTLTYSTLSGIGNSTATGNKWRLWGFGAGQQYGGTTAAYVEDNLTAVGQIVFTVNTPGIRLTLDSVSIGGFNGFRQNASVRVYDLNYNQLYTSGSFDAGFAAPVPVLPGLPSTTTGLIFQFGPDAQNNGVTSLTYTAVPEPAMWAMMIAGFGLVGAARRRQRIALAA